MTDLRELCACVLSRRDVLRAHLLAIEDAVERGDDASGTLDVQRALVGDELDYLGRLADALVAEIDALGMPS